MQFSRWHLLLITGLLAGPSAYADESDLISVYGQTTGVWQYKPSLSAAYSGSNSLRAAEERSYSFTTTLDLGLRLWKGAQLHVNPEVARGVPLSDLKGAGGLSNGELARTSGDQFNGYWARAFFVQRWDASSDTETLDGEFNEVGGRAATHRWTLVAGTISLLDYFDNVPYAKDPRSQFFNWSFMTHGAWDYAADARGYTHALLLEYRTPTWALRVARGSQPTESNGLPLDPDMRRRYGDQVELEGDLPLRLPAGPLHASLLWYQNQAVMGSFAEAIAQAQTNGGTPDVSSVRREQTKAGWGLAISAPTGEDSGIFLRTSRNDGATETYAFTEIDQQLAVGGQFSGKRWDRAQDRWGWGLSQNELSETHRAYLALGGLGAFLGDGRLNYAPERVFESWYRWTLASVSAGSRRIDSALTLGFQYLQNPGYNQDRGPAQVYSLRWHSEF